MFTIDGLRWPYPCDVTRGTELTASELSGLMLDKSYFNDVLGAYLRYQVGIAVPDGAMGEYCALFEALSAPVDGHQFQLPYNGDTVTITGRVENLSDVYLRLPGGGVHWKGVRFDVIANHPTKTLSLDEVIARGRTPFPDVATAAVGDTYRYTENGWVRVEYADADEVYY